MKRNVFCVCAATAVLTTFAGPSVPSVTMAYDADGALKIGYQLANPPAVVTLDIMTNSASGTWASIGGENIVPGLTPDSDVHRKVTGTSGTITWYPTQSWPGHRLPANSIKAVVRAWPLDNTPNYMVVDVSGSSAKGSQRYYPSADFLPGGLLSNKTYRLSSVVMRKIVATNVVWMMGSKSETAREASREAQHEVSLTNNYYIGVFPVTQMQHLLITGSGTSKISLDCAMRPADGVSYNQIRTSTGMSKDAADGFKYDWPNDPKPVSALGKLRDLTGIDFDLPSEAQWEYACRAGNGDGYWGNGAKYVSANGNIDENLDKLGRYMFDGGYIRNGDTWTAPTTWAFGPSNLTSVVGSYEPNDWGIYDMHGNVQEWCLDYYVAGIDDSAYANMQVNIDPNDPSKNYAGNSGGTGRVLRGGGYYGRSFQCRSAWRDARNIETSFDLTYSPGWRLCCRAGLR